MPTAPALSIDQGAIVALRRFDIAYAIDLAKAEQLWASQAGSGGTRGQLSTTPAKAMSLTHTRPSGARHGAQAGRYGDSGGRPAPHR